MNRKFSNQPIRCILTAYYHRKASLLSYWMEQIDFFLFLGTIFLTILFSTCFNHVWIPLNIQAVSLFSVQAISENVLFAAGVDLLRGSMIYHSKDRGQSWEALKSKGNNMDIAVSGDHHNLCAVGSTVYCLSINDNEEVSMKELSFRTTSRDITAVGVHGFAIVGMFSVPGIITTDRIPINGVAYNSNLLTNDWRFYEIGLEIAKGYFASHGSFPSSTTWYVTSGAWPVRSHSPIPTILSGKLNLIPDNDQYHHMNYEFLNLKDSQENVYSGAISKTIDGGKTWHQVFDSSKQYYLNQINCIDEMTCITVGEGSKATVALLTSDGGKTWETVLQLSGDYSLHACQMISSQEIWVSGGMIMKDNLRRRRLNYDSSNSENTYVGLYYHTINRGSTWELKTAEGYAYDLSFHGPDIGYAAVLFRDYASIERFL